MARSMSMILDHRGQPFRRRPIVGTEYAGIEAGRDITRGYVDDQLYLTPQDKVLRYQGGTQYELYEDMLQDDRVKSAFGQRRAAVVAREWAVDPGGERRRDRMAADHLRETLKHVQWDRVTDLMLYGVFYGYSVAEVLWTRDGRHVAMDRIRVRNRRRFVFDVHFAPLLLTADHPNGEPLPERKFWCFSAGADNDDEPYGRGLAHFLYWPIWFKKNQTRFWLLFLEKFGMPTPTAEYSRDEDKQKALALARAVHVDSALAVPEGVVLKFLEAMRSGSVDYGDFRRAMNDAITTIILSQTMTTEDGSSLSQAQVHMEVRREVVESDAWLIDESFRRGPAAWWTAMNYPGAATPEVRRVMEDPAELKDLADRDKAIVDMGHPLTAEYVEQTYHVEVDRTARPPPPAPAEPPDPTTDLAEDADPAAVLEQVLDAIDADEWQALAAPLIEPVLAKAARDPDGLLADLAALYPELDAGALTEQLARVLFVADVWGQLMADD